MGTFLEEAYSFVCMSVCPVDYRMPAHNSRMESHRKFKADVQNETGSRFNSDFVMHIEKRFLI